MLCGFQPVIYNRAIRGAVYKLPHTARNRARAFQQMRKMLAIPRAGLIHCTFISVQKYTACLTTLENCFSVFAEHSVVFREILHLHAKKSRKVLDVALGELDFRNAAAFGAPPAVDLVLNLSGRAPELTFDPLVR